MFKKLTFLTIAALMLASTAAFAATELAADLFSLDAPAPGDIATKITPNADKSLRFDAGWPTTVTLARIDVKGKNLQDTMLQYSAQLKSEGLKGSAYLEMWVHFPVNGDYYSRGLDHPLRGPAEWDDFQTPFVLKKGEIPDRIVLNLVIKGVGDVSIRNVHLRH